MLDKILGRPHKTANILTRTDKYFRVLNYPDVFGWWEGAGSPGENPHREEENVQTPHRGDQELHAAEQQIKKWNV